MKGLRKLAFILQRELRSRSTCPREFYSDFFQIHSYKTTKRVDKGRARSTAPLYPDDEWPHHIVFKFRYRPRGPFTTESEIFQLRTLCTDILMAEGYIPRPEQAKEEAEEIPDDDDDDVPVHTEDRKRLFIDDDDDGVSTICVTIRVHPD